MNSERTDWKPSEQELLDYANQEELFLFADEADYLAIANGVLELVQIRMEKITLQAKSVPEDYAYILAEIKALCQLICNSPPETTIKGEIESRAFMLGHFPDVLNSAPTQQADKVQCHYEYIVVDPTEESDAGIWPVLVPNGFKIVPDTEADSSQAKSEPIGWITDDYLTDKSATTYSKEVAERWIKKGWNVQPIYAAPQPADNWRNAAIRLGEELSNCGPNGYYSMGPWKWLDWALAATKQRKWISK